jgi:hypothetical protein
MKKIIATLLFDVLILMLSAQAQDVPTSARGKLAMQYSRPIFWNGSSYIPLGDSAHTHTFSSLTSKPTTLSGYGITDAVVNTITINGHDLSGNVTVSASDLSLGNVTNESKSTMFTNATFTGTFTVPSGVITNANLAGSIAYSKLSLTGAIVNGDLAGSVAYSKLSLTGAILNTDLAGSIAYSKLSITGAILNADLAGSIDATKINTGVVSNTEFNYLDGVTSAIQTQMDLKAPLASPTFTGTVTLPNSTVTNSMLAGSISYSKLTLTGAILNADLAGSIAYSKLSLTGAILNADLAGSIAYSKLSLTGAILNADLAGSIAYSKLSLTGAIVNGDLADPDLTTWAGITPASGVATFLATPSSANLFSMITNESGSGLVIGQTNPVIVGPTIGIAGTSVSSHITTVGTAPTVSQTGAGTGGSVGVAVDAGSTDQSGVITITTGNASVGSTGTVTLTFNGAYVTHTPVIVCTLVKGATDWGALATVRVTTESVSAPVITWNNSATGAAVALTANTTYKIAYTIIQK